MESKCVVCHERPARHRCIQCHKPVCDECAFKTENGVFCGRECSGQYREFKKANVGSRKSGGLGRKLFILLIVIIATIAVAWKMDLINWDTLGNAPGGTPGAQQP